MPLLQGIMRTMPMVGAGFGVAALAIAGVPPFNGFFSKYPLFAAGFELGHEYGWITWLMVLALIESTATFVWLLYKFGQCVIGKPSEAVAKAQPITLFNECCIGSSHGDVRMLQFYCRILAGFGRLG